MTVVVAEIECVTGIYASMVFTKTAIILIEFDGYTKRYIGPFHREYPDCRFPLSFSSNILIGSVCPLYRLETSRPTMKRMVRDLPLFLSMVQVVLTTTGNRR
jgi:hypothetical protein